VGTGAGHQLVATTIRRPLFTHEGVNGMEAVSTLADWQIMDFWDRLCTGLRARYLGICSQLFIGPSCQF